MNFDRWGLLSAYNPVAASEWRIQLPNGVSVSFTGVVDGEALASVLRAAAVIG